MHSTYEKRIKKYEPQQLPVIKIVIFTSPSPKLVWKSVYKFKVLPWKWTSSTEDGCIWQTEENGVTFIRKLMQLQPQLFEQQARKQYQGSWERWEGKWNCVYMYLNYSLPFGQAPLSSFAHPENVLNLLFLLFSWQTTFFGPCPLGNWVRKFTCTKMFSCPGWLDNTFFLQVLHDCN